MFTMSESLHAGHRERIIERVIASPDGLADHELLEVLLFSVLPRKDTNCIAHNLLKTFGNLAKVFSATPKELMAIDGVGKRVAAQLVVFGKIFERTTNTKLNNKDEMFSFETNREYLASLFEGTTKERFLVLMLDNKYKEITHVFYDTNSTSSVLIEPNELAKTLAINKPKYVVIAHNHPSELLRPSRDDDITTAKVYMLCKLHGITLIDHVIVSKERTYSYFLTGNLKTITDKIDLDDISKKI